MPMPTDIKHVSISNHSGPTLVRLSQKGFCRRRRHRHQRCSINNEKSVWYVIIYFYLITRQRLRQQTADRSCVATHTLPHTHSHSCIWSHGLWAALASKHHHRHPCCYRVCYSYAFSRDSHVGYLIKRSHLWRRRSPIINVTPNAFAPVCCACAHVCVSVCVQPLFSDVLLTFRN